MKKRMFYGFTLFVFLFLLVAWQFAAAELAELQAQPKSPVEEKESELAIL
ncbi:MAG: hypothetical protein WBL27_05770 [Salinimicrobium sp.]